jgi:hypothetical protein
MPNGVSKKKKEESLLRIPNPEPLAPDEFVSPNTGLDFWKVHEERLKRGLTTDQIAIEHPKNTFNLSQGRHYYVVEDAAAKSIACTSCPVKHGGILEAHLLTKYTIENGILYFEGKAVNKTPGLDKESN